MLFIHTHSIDTYVTIIMSWVSMGFHTLDGLLKCLEYILGCGFILKKLGIMGSHCLVITHLLALYIPVFLLIGGISYYLVHFSQDLPFKVYDEMSLLYPKEVSEQ